MVKLHYSVTTVQVPYHSSITNLSRCHNFDIFAVFGFIFYIKQFAFSSRRILSQGFRSRGTAPLVSASDRDERTRTRMLRTLVFVRVRYEHEQNRTPFSGVARTPNRTEHWISREARTQIEQNTEKYCMSEHKQNITQYFLSNENQHILITNNIYLKI